MSLREIAEQQQRVWDADRMAKWMGNKSDVRSYSISARSIEVPYESMTDEELKNLTNWNPIKQVSGECLLAAAKNRYPVGAVRVIECVDPKVA